jgi:ubiquinone/menaquinone biosynthesis C-methylase UbiE
MLPRTSLRVDYDNIAHLYDGQPHRAKVVDPELVTFIEQHPSADNLSILDIACGTGNQLVANREIVPEARLVGLDRSLGMLRQAQTKRHDIRWVQADGAQLPFPAESFDFVTCQFGLHHIPDKGGMISAVFRVLRPGGRFVMRNICPQEHPDWLYYAYFPEAYVLDLQDFWSPETIVTAMKAVGFETVAAVCQHLRLEQDMRALLEKARRRDMNSQLLAISDRAYEDGLRRLERDVAAGAQRVRADHLCLVTIRGDRN